MSFRNPVRAVGISGTVTTTSAGGGSSAVDLLLRGSSSVSTQSNTATLAPPASTAAGDFLVAIMVGIQGSVFANGWATVYNESTRDGAEGNGRPIGVMTRTATSADAGGGTTYDFFSTGVGGTGLSGTMVILAFSGGVGSAASFTRAWTAFANGGGTSVVASTPAVAEKGLLVFVATTSGSASNSTWAWVDSTGKPALSASVNAVVTTNGCGARVQTAKATTALASASARLSQPTTGGTTQGAGLIFTLS